MGFQEVVTKAEYPLDVDFIKRIIKAIMDSKETDNSSLSAVISNHRNNKRASKEDIDNFRYAIESIVSKAILKNDREKAIELSGASDDVLINVVSGMIKKNSPEYTALVNLKSKAYDLVGYKKDDKRKYITLNSSVLFPNNANLNDNDPLEHLFVINAPQEKYVSILKELFDEFIKNNIPVNFSVRDITDMVYGFADPIKIYVSTKYIEQAANIVYNVMKDKKLPKDYQPNDLLYLDMNGLFGYTTVDKAGRTPMEIVLSRMEKTINDEIVVNTNDWKERARKLKEYHDKNKGRYEDIIEKIDRNIMYSDDGNTNIDVSIDGNIFIFSGIYPKEEKVKKL